MDQPQLNSLDPKLREAYDRIMGTATKQGAQTASQSSPAPVNPQPQNTTPMQMHTEPVVSKPAEPAAPTPAVTLPSMPSSPDHPMAETPAQPAPAAATEQKNNAPFPSISQTPAFDPAVADNQMHAYVAQEVAGVKQSLKMIQVIYVVGGVVFFVVYALFWMKFFNVAPSI